MLFSLVDASFWFLLPSALMVAAGLWLTQRPHPASVAGLLAGLLMLYLLLTAFFGVAHRLTGSGIDSSVVYHLQTGLEGSGWQEFLPIIAGASVWLGLSLFVSFRLFRWLTRPANAVVPNRIALGQRSLRPRMALSGLLLAGAWVMHPGSHDLARLGLNTWWGASDTRDEQFVQVDPQNTVPATAPRDLVWIYLESVERTYLDDQRFPGLTPHLRRLQQQALDFADLQETEGAGWTIAGMVASQCGTPLLTLLHGNALTGADRFMSNAVCLSDVLAAQGYQLHYLGGASLQFAGKGAFYRTHGFKPAGLEELAPRTGPGSPRSNWGLHDDTLYEQAWQTLTAQAQDPAPLGLVMLTLDTHHPQGHVTPACRDLRYRDGRNPMLNAVHCADQLVAGFVQRLQQHPRLKNALIVISSDHLAMPNTASALLESGPRRNLLMLLHPDQPAMASQNPGTTLDTAPTLLSQLGIDTPALGYGRDLLGEAPTLLSSMGKNFNTYLLGRQQFLSQLWRHPDLRGGLVAGHQFIEVEQRQLRMPVLLTLSQELRVTSVAYPADARLPSLILGMPPEQTFIWADRCNLIMPLNGQTPDLEIRQCVAIGKAGKTWHVNALPPGQGLTLAQIAQQAHSEPSPANNTQQLAATRQNWLQWNSLNVDATPSLPGLQTRIAIRSSGRLNRPSQIVEQPDIDFVRGLTLLRVEQDGKSRKLAHLDTCASAPGQRVKDKVPLLTAAALRKSPPAGSVHVLVAHDSAVCPPSNLERLLKGSPFVKAASLQLRQPYVGVRTPEGQVYEFTSPPEQTLTAVLNPQDPA